jgi:hypothetical protein
MDRILQELIDFKNDFLDGAFPQRSALGPGTISPALLKAKSITSSMIDVSELAAVSANTGALTVTGAMSVTSGITIGTGGNIKEGMTTFADVAHDGFWLGNDSGTPKFRIGNAGSTSGLTWDGTTLTIKGSVTISNPTTAGIPYAAASAAGGAALSVNGGGTFSGALSAASGTFAGSLSAATGTFAGTLSAASITSGTLNCASITVSNFSASSITTGALTFSAAGTVNGASISGTLGNSGGTMNLGALTVSGTITLGAGGKIIDADGSFWDSTGITLVSAGSFGDSIKWKVGGVDVGSIWATSTGIFFGAPSGKDATLYGRGGNGGSVVCDSLGVSAYGKFFPGYSTNIGNQTNSIQCTGTVLSINLNDAAGSNSFQVLDNASQVQFSVTSNGAFTSPDADATALGTYAGRIPWYVGGNLRYIPYYNP